MEFNATIDLIIKDLDDARSIIDDLKKYPGVPLLQVEMAKAKCKSAGEVIALLKNLQSNESSDTETSYSVILSEKKVIISEGTNEPRLKEEKKEPVKPAKSDPALTVKKEKSDKIIPVTLTSDASSQLSSVKKSVPEQPGKKLAESTIIADTFSHLSNRFNEQLGNFKEEEDVTEIIKSKHVTNLSEAIGVNDKFLFVREIFNGNHDAFAQAISRLDNANNLADARAVIMSYTGDDIENEAVKQLLDLVKRKIPSDE